MCVESVYSAGGVPSCGDGTEGEQLAQHKSMSCTGKRIGYIATVFAYPHSDKRMSYLHQDCARTAEGNYCFTSDLPRRATRAIVTMILHLLPAVLLLSCAFNLIVGQRSLPTSAEKPHRRVVLLSLGPLSESGVCSQST